MKYFALDNSRVSVLLPENNDYKLFISQAIYFNEERSIKNNNCHFKDEDPYFTDTTIQYLSENKKVIIPSCISVAYTLHDFLGEILLYFDNDPNIEFIYCSENFELEKNKMSTIFNFIFKIFDDYKINYKIFDQSKNSNLIINNFYMFRNIPNTCYANLIYKYVYKYINNKDIKPFKKVYLSRSNITKFSYEKNNKYFFNEPRVDRTERIDQEEELENLFLNLGFEVVNPDMFNTFEDQINFFNQVKCLASLSGSGLTNSIFMQPNQNVIEIVTPLTHVLENYYEEQIHFYYSLMSFAKNHNHIMIPNEYRNFDNLNKKINHVMLDFMRNI